MSYGRIADKLEVGNLIQTQLDSFEWFKREGLRELFNEINPITDYTGKNYELRFLDYEFGEPKYDEEECRQRDMTFSAPLRINTRLHIKTGENAGEIKEAEVFMGDFAMMTKEGTFIINGTERVVVSQLVRSPGVYFTAAEDRTTGRLLYAAKLIPNRGAWLEIETSSKDVLTVKIDRKRKVPVTTLVRALGYATNEDIRAFFTEVDNDPEHQYIAATLDKDSSTSVEEALVELYRKIRPGDPPTVENAQPAHLALLQRPPLRPLQGRPLQARQEPRHQRGRGPRARRRQGAPSSGQPGLHLDHHQADQAQRRGWRARRHRPSRQSPGARGG